jgi:hypothetical protein
VLCGVVCDDLCVTRDDEQERVFVWLSRNEALPDDQRADYGREMDDVMMLMIGSSCCRSATNRKWMVFFSQQKKVI